MKPKQWPISTFMTPGPYSVQRNFSLSIAWTLMQEKKIRHLPVLDGTRVVGVLSLRNLQELMRTDQDVKRLTMDAAMSGEPYMVPPTAHTAEVAEHMAKTRIGSALIVDNGRLKGIFTTVDALRALAQLTQSPHEPAH